MLDYLLVTYSLYILKAELYTHTHTHTPSYTNLAHALEIMLTNEVVRSRWIFIGKLL